MRWMGRPRGEGRRTSELGDASDLRIPLAGRLARGEQIELQLDDRRIDAYRGETVAATLTAMGIRAFRDSPKRGDPRGLYCGIGVCFECLVVVDGRPNVRACMTYVEPGMRIQLQRRPGEPRSGERA